jgi:hypothetical protein
MRSKRLIGALAVAGALAVGISGVAIGAPAVQTLDVVIGGKSKPKLPKKDFKKTSLEATTTIQDGANPTGIPPKATKAVLTFDKKDVKFDTKAAPKCDPNQIENTTTEAALSACGQAVVGDGSGIASLPLGAGGTRQDFPAVVTAFNRADSKGILLHSRVNALGTTVVLKGALNKSTLSVDIPPLGGGVGAISEFNVTVKKGKYVQARCSDKTLKTKSSWTYSDAPTVSVPDKQKCKPKG